MHIYDKYLGVHCLSVVVAEKLVTGAACCTGVAPGVGGPWPTLGKKIRVRV